MSVPIDVRTYAGYRANERPQHFRVDEELFEIAEVEGRWYDPDAEYFKVRCTTGKRYLLRCSTEGEWTLERGFEESDLARRMASD